MNRIVATCLLAVLIIADATLANASSISGQDKGSSYRYREAPAFSDLFEDRRAAAPSKMDRQHGRFGTYAVDPDPVSDQ